MGLADLVCDMIASLGLAEAQAEAPLADDVVDHKDDSSNDAEEEEKPADESEEASAGGESENAAESEEEEAGEEEEAEEEPEEPEDPKPKLEEECRDSSQCAPAKHHFEECVERVTRQQEAADTKAPKEDCVEECESQSTRYYSVNTLDKAENRTKGQEFLPPPTLHNPMCRSKALEDVEIKSPLFCRMDLRILKFAFPTFLPELRSVSLLI
ncbi:hypothetical protein Egran_01954 [Elaphomyces granulatus]|uniref:Ubiquinol-cytochrome C reductase hinge domain-containing protein n=1 Tax=Elaphomyces granulatus TaxID=519963 RepID=A0A232M1U2_9EURO|nr:hypothetical protein Egran_01954 [Elaphomyces granulatus]